MGQLIERLFAPYLHETHMFSSVAIKIKKPGERWEVERLSDNMTFNLKKKIEWVFIV